MSRTFLPKVITANALLKGDAVWLTEGDVWSGDISQAELLEDEAYATVRLLFAEGQSDVIVGPYLADAKGSLNGPTPNHFREEFRSRGPSNYPHGKQTEL